MHGHAKVNGHAHYLCGGTGTVNRTTAYETKMPSVENAELFKATTSSDHLQTFTRFCQLLNSAIPCSGCAPVSGGLDYRKFPTPEEMT